MNLLNYTKNLYEKIKFYDNMTKSENSNTYAANPFSKPINITVIWVENKKL